MGRLSQSQKRAFKRHHGLIDDVTGKKYRPEETQQLVIGHIKPVAIGGSNDRENLFLTHRTVEDRINEVAYNMCCGDPALIHGCMEQLTRSILQLNEASEAYEEIKLSENTLL